ncbi:MAG: phosphoenolpyruvate carboxykinase (GTP) [Chitinivibrionales bacterium]|nr:phosphoenolpyruvate carboxykinase (GTP) [Chitinivibrionales bacterium]
MDSTITQNQKLLAWVTEIATLCQPDAIHWCDGSQQEYDTIAAEAVRNGSYIRLNEEKRPHCFLVRSDPNDVARVEDRTFICSKFKDDAGPTNNWRHPEEMKTLMRSLFVGCMRGRTMYVIPFSMGPLGSKISYVGIEITDSGYVVNNMSIMTRMGKAVLDILGPSGNFVKCLHSVGKPLAPGQQDVMWPCDSNNRYISHFPEERMIWSYGSGYGGNALLGKKCFALRIASVMARDEGWLAEHMLILGITPPNGEKKYIAAAFPSACGKTNLAMLIPTIPGWKVECVGDDIAWMKFNDDGYLHAVNPESGFFGVAPGTSMRSNPNAMLSLSQNSIFTNVAYTPDGDIWWEDMTESMPQRLIDWRGNEWTPQSKTTAAHANARFTAPASQCPVMDKSWEDPEGVRISAILFGGRRSSIVPLVHESLSWNHGVFLGSIMASEMTAAAAGTIGKLRRDPFAMLPFCGYHMADYFRHWISIGQSNDPQKLPRIYYVNWFRKSPQGKFLWPGYGENCRILKWIIERIAGTGKAMLTPIGAIPAANALDISGLNLSTESLSLALKIDTEEWKHEVDSIREHYSIFGSKLPEELNVELASLRNRLNGML